MPVNAPQNSPALGSDNWTIHQLGVISTKVDNVGQKVTEEGTRTTQRIDSLKGDIAGLSNRVDKVESDLDKFRGAGSALRIMWVLGGALVGGVALQVVLVLLGLR